MQSRSQTLSNHDNFISQPPRVGLRCLGQDCNTLVIHERICDECLNQAAIALCWRFEKELIDCGFEPGSADLRAALAGTATARSVVWYETNSDLGRVRNREAEELRGRTNTACFLVALGGVAALQHMTPTFRNAVAAWAHCMEPTRSAPEAKEADDAAVPAVLARVTAVDDDGARMAEFFSSLPRVDAGAMANPETRFDAYTAALFIIVILLLLHH